MMKMTILCVGKLKENHWQEAQAEYMKRLSRYAQVAVVEVADEKAPERLSAAEQEQLLSREADALLGKIEPGNLIVALAIEGKSMTSEAFSEKISAWGVEGKSRITFVIGGSLGLHDQLKQKADVLLSFSDFTFCHQMMRVILLEQIYRAFKIMKNETYHK